MRRAAAGAALAAIVLGLTACGSASTDPVQQARLDVIRRATVQYRDPNVALARGFFKVPGCVEASDDSGGLGTIYINLADPGTSVNLVRPQELFYTRGRLAGVGWFERSTGQQPVQTALGHMEGPLPSTRPGQPVRFELHAWLYKPSPDGVLSFWNKSISC